MPSTVHRVRQAVRAGSGSGVGSPAPRGGHRATAMEPRAPLMAVAAVLLRQPARWTRTRCVTRWCHGTSSDTRSGVCPYHAPKTTFTPFSTTVVLAPQPTPCVSVPGMLCGVPPPPTIPTAPVKWTRRTPLVHRPGAIPPGPWSVPRVDDSRPQGPAHRFMVFCSCAGPRQGNVPSGGGHRLRLGDSGVGGVA